MAQQHFPANREIEMVLLALQVFQVLFLWVQDRIPLGRLNDVAAVRSQDTRHRLVMSHSFKVYRGPSGYALACCSLDDRIPAGFTTGW